MAATTAVCSAMFVWTLIVVLSVPLALGLVGPNSIYGLRTTKTLSQPSIWYAANRFAGRTLCATGLVAFSLAVILLALLHHGVVSATLAATAAVILELVPLVLAATLSLQHLKRL